MDAIVLMGNANTPDGKLTRLAIQRVEEAVRAFKETRAKILIVCGGKGLHFNRSKKDHAFYLRSACIKAGVPRSRVIPLIRSKSTVDELIALPVLAREHMWKEALFVTSDFHMPRTRFLASFLDFPCKVGFRSVHTGEFFKHMPSEALKLLPSIGFVLRRRKRPLPAYLINRSLS